MVFDPVCATVVPLPPFELPPDAITNATTPAAPSATSATATPVEGSRGRKRAVRSRAVSRVGGSATRVAPRPPPLTAAGGASAARDLCLSAWFAAAASSVHVP